MQQKPHFDRLQQLQQNRQMGKWVSRLSLRSVGCGEEGRVSGPWAQARAGEAWKGGCRCSYRQASLSSGCVLGLKGCKLSCLREQKGW